MPNSEQPEKRRGKARTREASESYCPTLGGKSRFFKFLELSGVGRVVEDGTDVEESRTARLDEWIMCEAEERVAQ
jgi:hypothetical protein